MANFVQLKSGVVIPEASYAEIPRKPVMDEVAGWGGGRDITRGYVDSLPLLQPTDTVLQARGGDFVIYDEVARDDQVITCLRQRWDAVVAKETVVDPGDNSRRAKKAADHLKDVLVRIDWDDATRKMLAGEFYGYAVGEAMWATDGAMYTMDAVKVRRQERFGFSPQGDLRILTMRNPMGEAVPPAKFWAYSTGAWHDDDPYGLGMAHWLYWPAFFKRNGMKFWAIFLEKFGQPTAIGRYPYNKQDPTQKQNLLNALQAIQTSTAITIPDGMAVELLEATRSGTADYTAFVDRMNAAISKVLLGHTGSTDATPGRLGGEINAAEVRDDIIKASSDLICMSFTRTIATWLTRLNDDQAPIPRVFRRVESDPDLKAQAERDKIIFDMGFKPTAEYITETYAIPVTEIQPPAEQQSALTQTGKPATDATELPNGQEQPTEDPTAFADGEQAGAAADQAAGKTEQDIPQLQADTLAASADTLINVLLLDPARELLKECSDLGEFRDRLAELYPKMDAQQLAEELTDGFLAAELAGRDAMKEGR